jgi:chloride channel 3/4/5
LFGASLCKLIILYTKYIRNRTWLKRWPVAEVMMVVIITAAVNFGNKYTRMSNTDLVFGLFSECTDEKEHDGLCEYVIYIFRKESVYIYAKSNLYRNLLNLQ